MKKLSSDPSEIQTLELLHDYFSKEMVESFPDDYYRRGIDLAKTLWSVEFSRKRSVQIV